MTFDTAAWNIDLRQWRKGIKVPGYIRIIDIAVSLGHGEGGMPQESLQCERIAAAVLQVFLCEGVPEQMDTCLLDTSGFIVVSHSKSQSVLCQHFPILIAEQVYKCG